MQRIAVVGLGKLGLPIAACLASRGYSVNGVDNNDEAKWNALIGESVEPYVSNMLKSYPLTYVVDSAQVATESADATFVVVPTPLDNSNRFSLDAILSVCEEVGKTIKDKVDYHLIVIVSTVMPEAHRKFIIPTLEKASGKQAGRDFGICYSPAFLALGTAVQNILSPDFVLIGADDDRSANELESIQRPLVGLNVPIMHTSIINAEIAKIALNVYLSLKITYGNTIAHLCDHIDGADAEEVTRVIGRDRRVGKSLLMGGTPYGGPCLCRDMQAFIEQCHISGADPLLFQSAETLNRMETNHIYSLVYQHIDGGTIGILGLAYKPDTAVTDNSIGHTLAQRLTRDGKKVVAYDPLVTDAPCQVTETALDCVNKSGTIVITQPHHFLKENEYDALEGKVVIDLWRTLNTKKLPQLTYIIPGKA